jgi:hypothetical protein
VHVPRRSRPCRPDLLADAPPEVLRDAVLTALADVPLTAPPHALPA